MTVASSNAFNALPVVTSTVAGESSLNVSLPKRFFPLPNANFPSTLVSIGVDNLPYPILIDCPRIFGPCSVGIDNKDPFTGESVLKGTPTVSTATLLAKLIGPNCL